VTSAAISAVVVYYRTPRALAECVGALARQGLPPGRIVVVDNSACEEGRAAPPSDGGFTWVRSARNCGFGSACNLGALRSDAPFLLFVNADVSVCPGALDSLLARAQHEPRLGAVAPRVLDAGGAIELNARRFPRLRTGVLGRASRATNLLRRMGHLPRDLAAAQRAAGPVDWVSGACMLVRRDAFDAVGGFDEGYWMYWEDADLCKRLADAGWETWFEPAAVVRHATGSSGTSRRTVRAFHESAARYYSRHVARRRLSRRLAAVALRARSSVLVRRLG
jgi:GT2 family glycosyltransferase